MCFLSRYSRFYARSVSSDMETLKESVGSHVMGTKL